MAFIAGIVVFIFLLQKLDSPGMTPVRAALILILSYVTLQSVTMGFMYYMQGVPIMPNLFNLMTIGTAFLQFIAAATVFGRVNESGEDYLSYALWGGIGLATVFFVVPLCMQLIVMTL